MSDRMRLSRAAEDLRFPPDERAVGPIDSSTTCGFVASYRLSLNVRESNKWQLQVRSRVDHRSLFMTNAVSCSSPSLRGLDRATDCSDSPRSEERRVGKECRSRWWTYQ